MLKAVVFDLFGTLIDNLSRDEFAKITAKMATLTGADPEQFTCYWVSKFSERMVGRPATLAIAIQEASLAAGANPSPEQLQQAAVVRIGYTRDKLRSRPESVGILMQIKSQGLASGLISDCSWEVPMLWEQSPFNCYFDATVFSCREGMRKPDRRLFQLAADRLSVDPSECLYIADGVNGELQAAEATGMQAVLIIDPTDDPVSVDKQASGAWRGRRISSLAGVLDYIS